jgi:hypothetical protein
VGDRLTGSVPRLDNGVQYAVLVSARNAGGASPGSAILPAVPGSAFLPVTGSSAAPVVALGLLVVLLGITLVVAMERDGTPR